MKHVLHLMLATAAGLLVGGCTVGPDYTAPQPAMPAAFSVDTAQALQRPGTGPEEVADGPQADAWWNAFGDPILVELIRDAAAWNNNLVVAQARVREARAFRRISNADFFPQVGSNGQYAWGSQSLNTGAPPGADRTESGTWQAGFDATWEIDVFGRTRRSVEAADAEIAASEELLNDTLLTLMGDVATNYIQLRSLQQQILLTRDSIASQQNTLDLTIAKVKGGLNSGLDVAQAEAQVATTEGTLPLLQLRLETTLHRLSVLTGRPPRALIELLETAGPIPVVEGGVPLGLPSELLRRRPDVRAAERQLAAANARVGVAIADLYPRFSLFGGLGLTSTELEDFPEGDSLFYNIGPRISWPIFSAGKLRSNIDVQNAQQEAAAARYEDTVLRSLEDVENALVSYQQNQLRRGSLAKAVDANTRATDLANQLFEAGLGDYLAVLISQRELFRSQIELANSESQVATDLVALYKAMGGGWTEHPDVMQRTYDKPKTIEVIDSPPAFGMPDGVVQTVAQPMATP